MPVGAAAASSTPPSDYVRLLFWSHSNAVNIAWVDKDKVLQLSKDGPPVRLTVSKREAGFNGTVVWLWRPVIQHEGKLFISALDARITLMALLSPSPRRGPVRTICLDPGHGGKDPGFQVGSAVEKRQTLLLANEVRAHLKKAGYKVVFTRTKDVFIELPDRARMARNAKADLFVSLHFNATDGNHTSAQGSEVYCLTPAGASSTNAGGEGATTAKSPGNQYDSDNLLFACSVQRALVRELGVEDRGVRRARYAVLREAEMPAVLIEAGFMSHPVEGKKILTSAYRSKIAKAIAGGIESFAKRSSGASTSSGSRDS